MIKPREENVGEYFCDLRVGKLIINTQCTNHRWKLNKLDYIKIYFCTPWAKLTEMIGWEKIFVAWKLKGIGHQWEWQSKNLQKNCFSIKAMRTLAKIIKINFFRTLEINQRLATIWEAFIEEKWLNLCNKSRPLAQFSCPSPHLGISLGN